MSGPAAIRLLVSKSLVHEIVGSKQASELTWEVYFRPILLGTLRSEGSELGLIHRYAFTGWSPDLLAA